ncbi:MAG: triose-phosphate isomerase [Candidatus Latescibacteria bacterium]|jgi:triosephosphate isomerase|nr:triose-phosphate isomerase [Candidatus Latescibacterota bacterium]
MRTPFVAGNWKLNKTSDEAEILAQGLVNALSDVAGVEVAICPPFTALERVSGVVKDSVVGLGAQNLYWESEGAFTGEVSAAMLLTCGCEYVILGHSERRQFFGETDETVNRRLKAALSANLKPIVCVGETLDERQSDVTEQIVETQVTGAFEGVSPEEAQGVTLAYEPVWAIGTGLTATPEQAEAVHAFLRQVLAQFYNDDVAQAVRIQYGGSVKPDNATELFGQNNIDGGLIGGAALDADSFAAIVKAAV